jgi:hypothetical protein
MPFLSVTLCQYHTLSLFVTLLCIHAQTHPGKQNQLASVRHANDRGNHETILILGIPDSRFSSSSLSFMLPLVSFPCTTERRSFLTVGYSSGFTWSGGHKKAFNRRRLFSLSLLFSILALLLNNTTKLPFICSFPIPSLLRCYILIYTVIIALAFLKARHLSLTSCDSASQPAILVCLPKTSLAIYNATHPAQAR